jgi:hypothetical protein
MKVACFDLEDVYTFLAFGMAKRLPNFICIPLFPELPQDCIVGAVKEEPFHRVFEFQVFHETFPPVEIGVKIPRIMPRYEVKEVRVAAKEDEVSGCITTSFSAEDTASVGTISTKTNRPDECNFVVLDGGRFVVDQESARRLAERDSARWTKSNDRVNPKPMLVDPEIREAIAASTRFSLKMVAFGELPAGQPFFASGWSDNKEGLVNRVKTNPVNIPGIAKGMNAKVANSDTYAYFTEDANVFVKAENPDDPCLPFYYDNGQLKSRYTEQFGKAADIEAATPITVGAQRSLDKPAVVVDKPITFREFL